MHKKIFGLLSLLMYVVFLTGCGGGSGSSNPVGPTPLILGNMVLEGYVSNAPISGAIRAAAQTTVTIPAVGATVQAGQYNSAGVFEPFAGVNGLTDSSGKYTLLIPADKKNRRNIIIRALLLNAVFEGVVSELPQTGKGIAPIMDNNTKSQSLLIRETAKRKAGLAEGTDINLADILSRIPPETLSKMGPDDIGAIADAFVERENARSTFANGLAYGPKIQDLRDFGFKQTRLIVEGIEAGIYSREEGWKLFDEMMQLQAKALGLPQDFIKLLNDIDVSVNDALNENISNPGFPGDEILREAELKKYTETAEMFRTAVKTFKNFRVSNNLVIEEAELAAIEAELAKLLETIKYAPDAAGVGAFFHRHPVFALIQGYMNRMFKRLGLFEKVNGEMLLNSLLVAEQKQLDPASPYQTMEYRLAQKSDIVKNINGHLQGLDLSLEQVECLANMLLAYQQMGFSIYDDAPPPADDEDINNSCGEIMGTVIKLNAPVESNGNSYLFKISMPEQFGASTGLDNGFFAYARVDGYPLEASADIKVYKCLYEKPMITEEGNKIPCIVIVSVIDTPPPVIQPPVEPGNVFFGLLEKRSGRFYIGADISIVSSDDSASSIESREVSKSDSGYAYGSGFAISIEFVGSAEINLESYVNKYVKIEGKVIDRTSTTDFTPAIVQVLQIAEAQIDNYAHPGYAEGFRGND